MSIPTNFQRATWAANAIETFRSDTGNLSDEEAVHDLICDLGHYCRLYELDFLRLAANGISTWCAECEDPDGFRLDPGPKVSILIPSRKPPVRSWRQSTTAAKPRKRRGGAP